VGEAEPKPRAADGAAARASPELFAELAEYSQQLEQATPRDYRVGGPKIFPRLTMARRLAPRVRHPISLSRSNRGRTS